MNAITTGIAAAFFFILSSVNHAAAMSSDGTMGPMSPAIKDGMAAVEAKNFEEAERLLKQGVSEVPNSPEGWSMLGFVSRKLGKLDASFAAYQESLAINPEFRPALNYLGHYYIETGQLDKAKETLEKLSSACFFGCNEYDDLKKAVADGKSGKY